eukprot:CAMPEP_0201479620 /NCGR_PEP_ID=MMETSP0151_2-20130828/4293_1 /ASSEMBLY_ACC=CAM_ASM_000257 /TAXON_ID=200890 /ORGANISM="Paramoeba atlantica, Strain 621/1 / CCAP 1560/9" /LENGTH=663 /DNA_ID=CAMNT_0047861197 /DNA_START=54 /DNA_END=2042 /DNA_ORIENTATION=-
MAMWERAFFLLVLGFGCWDWGIEGRRSGMPDIDYISQMIYPPISGGAPCIALLDSNGQLGCRSDRGGIIGELRPLETEEDVSNFKENGFGIDHQAVLVVGWEMWARVASGLAERKKEIAGVLVDQSDENRKPLQYSPDEAFPNKEFGLYPDSTYEWNPNGNGLSFLNAQIPIFAVTDEEEAKTLFQHARSNDEGKSSPPWFAELTAFMSAATNTKICLERGFCEPLGGQSVISSPIPFRESTPIILATASLDSTAFFHDLAVGANSDMSSLVVLLTAYDALRQNASSLSDLPSQLVFAFFNGESYGYLGSRKFVDDLTGFQCSKGDDSSCEKPFKPSLNFTKIDFSKISQILELKQVGNGIPGNFYTYADPGSQSPETISSALNTAASLNSSVSFQPSPVALDHGIPPSSLMSFLRKSRTIPGLVVTDHDGPYENKYYHGEGDTRENIESVDSMCNLATATARALYLLASESDTADTFADDLQANCTLLDELLGCFTVNWSCPIVEEYLQIEISPDYPPPNHYVSTFRYLHNLGLTEMFVYTFLSSASPPSADESPVTDCEEGCPLGTICEAGECQGSWTFFHDALSPAFKCKKMSNGNCFDWEMEADTSDPTFTESYWGNEPSFRIFQREADWMKYMMLAFGLVQILVVWFLSNKFWQPKIW